MLTGVNLDFWAARPDMDAQRAAIAQTDAKIVRPMNWLGSYWAPTLWPENDEGWRWPRGPWKEWTVPLGAAIDFVNSVGAVGVYDLPFGLTDAQIAAACALIEERSHEAYYVGIGSEAWNSADEWGDQRKFFAWYGGLHRWDNWQRGYAARLRMVRKHAGRRGKVYATLQLMNEPLNKQLLIEFGLGEVVDAIAVAPYVGAPHRVRVGEYRSVDELGAAMAQDLRFVVGRLEALQLLAQHVRRPWLAYEAGLHMVSALPLAAEYDRHWHAAHVLRELARAMNRLGCEAVCWYKLSEIVPQRGGVTRFGLWQADRPNGDYVETAKSGILYHGGGL